MHATDKKQLSSTLQAAVIDSYDNKKAAKMMSILTVRFPDLSTEAQTAAAGLLMLLPVLIRYCSTGY